MKHSFLIFLFLFSIQSYSQVPVPRREIAAEAPIHSENSDNASYYREKGKYGFIYPKNKRQEALYDKITYGLNGYIVQKGKLYGITDNKGIALSRIEFDSVMILNNHYLVKKKGKSGLLSNKGDLLLSIKYDKILGTNTKVSIVQNKKGDVQLVKNENEKLLISKIEKVVLYHNIAIVKTKGKFGVVSDKIIVPFEYDSIAHSILKNLSTIQKTPNRNVVETRNISRPPIFDFVVLKDGKLGLINSEGVIIYAAENDEVHRESAKAYYLVKKENLFSIYFPSTVKKTAFEYSRVYADGYGYVMAVKNNKAGVFDLKGEEIVPFEYDNDGIYQYSGIGLRVTKNKKRGIVDPKGNILVPVIYDDVSTLYETGFSSFIKVSSGKNSGIVNLKGEVVIPLNFEWVGTEQNLFKVATHEPDRKFGLYDKNGKQVVPADYQWITRTATENSKIIVLKSYDRSYNFLNERNEMVLAENFNDYGYLHDEDLLLNPFSSGGKYLIYVKGKDGKYGMINEMTGTLDIPFVYDEIMQHFSGRSHSFYSVRKGRKFGLVNEKNEVVIPIIYDDINIDLVGDGRDSNYQVIVAKRKQYGTVNLMNEVQIPFEYKELKRISGNGLYKAKKGLFYQIINSKNEKISNDFFDEVANFEPLDSGEYGYDDPVYRALAFRNGKMRAIDEKGQYRSSEISMEPHIGFSSFDELKFSLVKALDSHDDVLLKDFVNKIAPSGHILFYLKRNMFNDELLGDINIPYIKEKYFEDLLRFKQSYWRKGSGSGFDRSSLTEVTDFTLYRDGYVTNVRNTDHAFGSVKYLEKFLRNAIKINGFWISSYFMKRSF